MGNIQPNLGMIKNHKKYRISGLPLIFDIRAKTNLSSRIKVIWVVQSPSQKYSPFPYGPNHLHTSRIPARMSNYAEK